MSTRSGIQEAYKTLQEIIVINGPSPKHSTLIEDTGKVVHNITSVIFLLMLLEEIDGRGER